MEENEKVIVKEIVRIEEPQTVKAEVVNQVQTDVPWPIYWFMFIQIVLTGIIAWQLHNGFYIY